VRGLGRALTLVENVVASAALALAALIAIAAVVLRYVFNVLIFWSEEAVIYLVLLSVFVGAVITLRHDEHVRVDLLPTVLKGRLKLGVQVLASLLTLVSLEVLVRQLTGRDPHPEAHHSVLDAEAAGLGMHIEPAKGTDPRGTQP
jgi:TRAP-type C4-dicarboxylate transport system permease small subunit